MKVRTLFAFKKVLAASKKVRSIKMRKLKFSVKLFLSLPMIQVGPGGPPPFGEGPPPIQASGPARSRTAGSRGVPSQRRLDCKKSGRF